MCNETQEETTELYQHLKQNIGANFWGGVAESPPRPYARTSNKVQSQTLAG